MTRAEFAQGIHLLKTAIGKAPTDDQLALYWEILLDLPFAAFRAGCIRVLTEHVWNTFPSIAELVKATNEIAAPSRLTAAEAFTMAQLAAVQIDPRVVGPYRVRVNGEWQEFDTQADYVFARLKVPERVQRAIRVFGIEALCNTDEPIAVMRAHFAKTFDQLEDRDRREALLPPEVRRILEAKPTPKAAIETRRDSEAIRQAMATIGGMPG